LLYSYDITLIAACAMIYFAAVMSPLAASAAMMFVAPSIMPPPADYNMRHFRPPCLIACCTRLPPLISDAAVTAGDDTA